MIDEVIQTAIATVLAALVGGGLVAWINARARKPLVEAAAAVQLSGGTLKWAEQLLKQVKDANERGDRIREEADRDIAGLRSQVDELTAKLSDAIDQVDALRDKFVMVQTEAWRPEPDVSAIRRLVGRPHHGDNNWR